METAPIINILWVLIGIVLLGGSIYLFALTRHFIKIIGTTIIGTLFLHLILGWFISLLILSVISLSYPIFFNHFGLIVIFCLWSASLLTLIKILLTGIHHAAQILRLIQVNEKDLLKEIIDQAPIGIYTINNRGIIDSFNPRMVELAGAKGADEVIGLDALSMESYKNVGLDKYFRAGLEGKAFETEVHYTSQTGKKDTWRHYRGVPLYSINGVNVARLLLMVSDITPRKELENQLVQSAKDLDLEVQKRTQKLELLSDQYKTVVEGSLIGFYILQDNIFKYVNQVFLSIFGYNKSEEIIGKSWHMVVTVKDIEVVNQSGLQDRMSGNGNPVHYSFHGKKKDGTIIEVETLSSPSLYDGKPAVIGSLQNVTERTRMEEEIQSHVEELEEMNKLMVNRELVMVELKKQVVELQNKLSKQNLS